MNDQNTEPSIGGERGQQLSGATRLAAVIGDPVRHSRSPALHNAAFAARALDWVYVALPVAAGSGHLAIEAARVLGIEGLSVTMPHKADVAATVDRKSAAVERLGACNCVAREGDLMVGHNTDGAGFVASVQAETDFNFSGSRVAVVGAGGAARAIIYAVAEAGAEHVMILNRTRERAEAAAALVGSGKATGAARGTVATIDDLRSADLIINATSVGMSGSSQEPAMPFDPNVISDSHLVADIVYQPEVTPLLAEAARRGARTIGGLGMLVHQAAAQFELWTGEDAPLDVMTKVLRVTAHNPVSGADLSSMSSDSRAE